LHNNVGSLDLSKLGDCKPHQASDRKEPNMLIIGLDYQSVQQIAFVDLETGETGERQLNHNEGEVEEFYREVKQRRISVRVGMGMEATGQHMLVRATHDGTWIRTLDW
jgi:hypothetical protein